MRPKKKLHRKTQKPQRFPGFFVPCFQVQAYLNGFRKKAAKHKQRQKNGLHPYDREIVFRDIDDTSFEIDITKWGFIVVVKEFDAEGMIYGICNMDYMIFRYMGNGLKRIMTLGCTEMNQLEDEIMHG